MLLAEVSFIRTLGETTLLIQQSQDTLGWLLDQFQSLSVVCELDVGEINSLCLVFSLLERKHVVIEEFVQLLVGKVDAQLFKANKG